MAKKAKAKAKSKSKRAAKKTPARKRAKSAIGPNRIKSVIALADLQPPGPHHFYVRARVQVPTPGFHAHLKKAVPQGINPAILILDVVLTPLPGIWPQHVTDIDAIYDDRYYTGNYEEVTVRYGTDAKTVVVVV